MALVKHRARHRQPLPTKADARQLDTVVIVPRVGHDRHPGKLWRRLLLLLLGVVLLLLLLGVCWGQGQRRVTWYQCT